MWPFKRRAADETVFLDIVTRAGVLDVHLAFDDESDATAQLNLAREVLRGDDDAITVTMPFHGTRASFTIPVEDIRDLKVERRVPNRRDAL